MLDRSTSSAPEKLLRALQVLYSIRSERFLMEQTGLQSVVPLVWWPQPERPGWDVTVFTKNRNLLDSKVATEFTHHC